MLKYKCLVLDHDDTIVQSEATVNYPCFVSYLNTYHPGVELTLESYVDGCCNLGFLEMCRKWYGFDEAEMDREFHYWQDYVRTNRPLPFPGVEKIIRRQKAAGGLVCVVSHSCRDNIIRDYQTHFGLLPDAIYGWDYPEHQRKPSPWPLEQILEKFHLRPEDLLVLDDMKPAWEMARKVGVHIAFAQWGKKDYPAIVADMRARCDFAFETPGDLERYLFTENS